MINVNFSFAKKKNTSTSIHIQWIIWIIWILIVISPLNKKPEQLIFQRNRGTDHRLQRMWFDDSTITTFTDFTTNVSFDQQTKITNHGWNFSHLVLVLICRCLISEEQTIKNHFMTQILDTNN
jgi:predicted glycosyltransferase involved in capsule biosynthesis